MHNFIKRILPIIMLSVILHGCSFGSVSVKKNITEYETDNEIVYVETPIVEGLSDKTFQEQLNTQYSGLITSMLDEYLEESKKTVGERDGKSNFEIKHEVMYNKDSLLSIVGNCYKYTDGFNGTNTRIVKNINTITNSEILLSDIFADDEYTQMLNTKLEKLSEDAKYSDLWERPKITDTQNHFFYFSNEGLVIFYPPYELSYYARGFVEFTISYSDLYGYLKPEYSFLY